LRAEVEVKYCLLLLLIFQILDNPPSKAKYSRIP
jgi:hypothetical protein